jgi:uncharacterized protein (TIGR02597 family)
MKLLPSISTAFLASGLLFSLNAQSVTTDPVGYVTVEVTGIGTTVLGIPLIREEAFRGEIVGINGLELSLDSGLSSIPTSSGENYFIQILDGNFSGAMVQIFSFDSDSILTLAEDISSVLSLGDRISIRRHWTLGDLFGPSNESSFVFGGNSVIDPSADRLIIDGVVYYYKSGGIGGTGWRTAGNVDAQNAVIWPTSAITLIRRSDIPSNLTLTGEVSTSQLLAAIETGTNRISSLLPVGLTLENSGLFDPESPFSVKGGNSVIDPNADRLIFDGQVFYYKSGGIGGTGWRTAGNLDASNVILPSSFTLIRRGDPSNLLIPSNL